MKGLLTFLFGGAAVVAASSMAKKKSNSKLVYERLPDGKGGFYRAKEADEMAKGGGIQKVWYKREGKKDYYFDKDAIWYQNYGVYKKGEDGLEYSTKEEVNKTYKRKSGMDMINSFRKNRDYKIIDEKFSDGVLYYIAFLDLSDGTNSNTISFSSGDLYAKGGGVRAYKALRSKVKSSYNKATRPERIKMLTKAGFGELVANDLSKEVWDSLDSNAQLAIIYKGDKKLKYGGDPQDSLFLEMYVKVTSVNEDGAETTTKGWIKVNSVYSDDEMYEDIKSELGINPEDITDVEILKERVV